MQMTIDVDDELLACVTAFTGIEDRAALIQQALELLVRIESRWYLGALAGSG